MIQKLSKLIDSLDRHTAVRNAVDVLFFPTALVYMEILAKLRAFGELFDGSFHYLFFLSLAMGFLLSGVSMLLSGKPRRLFYIITLALQQFQHVFFVADTGSGEGRDGILERGISCGCGRMVHHSGFFRTVDRFLLFGNIHCS